MSKDTIPFKKGTPERQRLEELCSMACDGRLAEADHAELDVMLSVSSDARAIYRRFMNLHATLRSYLAPGEPVAGVSGEQESAATLMPRIPPGKVTAMRPQPKPRVNLVVLAAAALVMFGLFFTAIDWLWERMPAPAGSGGALAMLSQTLDSRWAPGTEVPEIGKDLGSERLRLQSGRARIDFKKGARLFMAGGSDVELLSDNSARLRAGTFYAKVPPSASGFTLKTDAFDIVDLGTAFGVSITETGDVEVTVLEGKVEIAVRDSVSGEMVPIQQIRQGRSVVAHPGTLGVDKTSFKRAPYEELTSLE